MAGDRERLARRPAAAWSRSGRGLCAAASGRRRVEAAAARHALLHDGDRCRGGGSSGAPAGRRAPASRRTAWRACAARSPGGMSRSEALLLGGTHRVAELGRLASVGVVEATLLDGRVGRRPEGIGEQEAADHEQQVGEQTTQVAAALGGRLRRVNRCQRAIRSWYGREKGPASAAGHRPPAPSAR